MNQNQLSFIVCLRPGIHPAFCNIAAAYVDYLAVLRLYSNGDVVVVYLRLLDINKIDTGSDKLYSLY